MFLYHDCNGHIQFILGIFVLNPDSLTTDNEAGDGDALSRWGVVDKNVTFFRDEQEMILKFVQLVKVKDFILSLETIKLVAKNVNTFYTEKLSN